MATHTAYAYSRRGFGFLVEAIASRSESCAKLEAVITGAAGNFGAVCARMMAAEGAKLALVDLVEDLKQEKTSSLVTGQTAGSGIRGA